MSTAAIAQSDEAKMQEAFDGLDAHWKHRSAALMLQSAVVTKTPDLVVFGDSRIEGIPALKIGGIDAALWGYGGMTLLHAPQQLGALHGFGYRPRRFISVVGINTVYFGINQPQNSNWSERRAAVDRFVYVCSGLSPHSVVCTVVPYEEGFEGPGITSELARQAVEPTREINALIVEAAKRERVEVFDLHGLMTNDRGTCRKGYTIDAIHWSAAGARALAAALATA